MPGQVEWLEETYQKFKNDGKEVKESCAGCNSFVAYEGCVLLVGTCENGNKREAKPEGE